MKEYLLREFRRMEKSYDEEYNKAVDDEDKYLIAYYQGMREAIHKAWYRVKIY